MPIFATHKKARFDYEILERLEAGLVLTGAEVKSIRQGSAKLDGSFVMVRGRGATIVNMHIGAYPYATNPHYIPDATRKLLLSAKEINYLRGKTEEKGLTIVPLSLYTKGTLIKLEIGIAKGKKIHDKRRTIKEREGKRSLQRMLKHGRDD
ncbi:MAG TPA: SsrA-binding protein SmpB [Candidatus Magasanikbacteria bacterium]|nr:SsrA-binding protein SmpB [Candidatus Magasanikbacteria bacterium]